MRQEPLPIGMFDQQLPRWATARNLFLMLLLIALLIDLGFGLLYRFRLTPAGLEADEAEYYDMASRMLAGTFEVSARRTLAFPLLIAGIRSLTDSFLALQAIVTAAFAFSAPLLFLVVRRVTHSRFAGALAGLAVALWPPVLFYGVSLYSETLAMPIFLLALWALPPGSRTGQPTSARDVWSCVAAGVLLAAATQVRPMYLLMTPFLALIILFEEADLRVAFRRLALCAAAFTLTTLPWAAYMTSRFHHPILVTSNGGETLSGGLNPKLLEPDAGHAAPTPGRHVWVGPGKWLTVSDNGYLTQAERALPYDQQDALLKARTMAWVKAHPAQAAQLEAAKVLYLWGLYPLLRNGWQQFLLGCLPTICLLGLSLYYLATMRAVRGALVRFWILPIFVTGVAAISWGSWRFRQPGDVGLLAFCVICFLIRRAARDADQTAGSAR